MTSPITHENIIEVLRPFVAVAEELDPELGDLTISIGAAITGEWRAARDLYQRLQAEKEGGETKPVLCIGLETLTLLARNKELNLENVALIPADSFPYALFAPPASGTDSSGRAALLAAFENITSLLDMPMVEAALASEFDRGRRSGIEQAAKVADDAKAEFHGVDGWAAVAIKRIADNIRALLTNPEKTI